MPLDIKKALDEATRVLDTSIELDVDGATKALDELRKSVQSSENTLEALAKRLQAVEKSKMGAKKKAVEIKALQKQMDELTDTVLDGKSAIVNLDGALAKTALSMSKTGSSAKKMFGALDDKKLKKFTGAMNDNGVAAAKLKAAYDRDRKAHETNRRALEKHYKAILGGTAVNREMVKSISDLVAENNQLSQSMSATQSTVADMSERIDVASDAAESSAKQIGVLSDSLKQLVDSGTSVGQVDLNPEAWEKLSKAVGANVDVAESLKKPYDEAKTELGQVTEELNKLRTATINSGAATEEQIVRAQFLERRAGELGKTLKNVSHDVDFLTKNYRNGAMVVQSMGKATKDYANELDAGSGEINKAEFALRNLDMALSSTHKKIRGGAWEDFSEQSGKVGVELQKIQEDYERVGKDIDKNTKSMQTAGSQLRNLTAQYKDLEETKRKNGGLNAIETAQYEDIVKNIQDTTNDIEKMTNEVRGFQKSQKAVEGQVNTFREYARVSKEATKAVKELNKGLKDTDFRLAAESSEGFTKELQDQQIKYQNLGEQMKEHNRLMAESAQELANLKDKTGDEAEALRKEIRSRQDSILTIKEEREEIHQSVEAAKSLSEVENDLAKRTSLFGKAMAEAKEEARGFMGGMGGSATGATALAVAMIYTATKIKELGGELVETQKKWAEFGAETTRAQHIVDMGISTANIKNLRTELGLTAEQTRELGNIMAREMPNGVISINKLVESARKLESAFGEEPTKRLKEYVEMLKEIPTLETDLNITASLDDQAATWFALAKKGKVQNVIEMQMAGLAGGEKEPEGSEAEIETLREIRRGTAASESMQKILGDIANHTLTSLGYWTQIIGATMTAGATAWSGLVIGASQLKMLRRISENTERSGNKSDTKSISGAIQKSFTDLKGSFNNIFKSATESGKGSFGASRMALSGGLANAGGSMLTGGITQGGVAGAGMKVLGGAITALGTNVSSLTALTGATGSALGGVGVAAISVLGPLTAMVAPIALITAYGEDAGKGLKSFSKKIKDTPINDIGSFLMMLNPVGLIIRAAGGDFASTVDWMGDKLVTAGKWWSDTVGVASDMIFMGRKEMALKKFALKQQILQTRELKKEQQALREMQQSALAMQGILQGFEGAVNSAKKQLYTATKEAGNFGLELMSVAGGSMANFDSSVRMVADGMSSEFKLVIDAAGAYRRMTMRDVKLTPEMRKAALIEIKKKELEATKIFVDGVLQLVDKMLKTPDILARELKNKTASMEIETDFEFGSGGLEANMKKIGDSVRNGGLNLVSSLDAAAKASKVADEELAKLDAQKANNARDAADNMRKTAEGLRKAGKVPLAEEFERMADGMFDSSGKVLAKGVDEAQKHQSDIYNAMKELAKSKAGGIDFSQLDDSAITESEKKIHEFNEKLSGLGIAGTKELSAEYEKARTRVARADSSAMQSVKSGAGLERSIAEQKEANEELKKLQQLRDEQASLEAAQASHTADYAKIAGATFPQIKKLAISQGQSEESFKGIEGNVQNEIAYTKKFTAYWNELHKDSQRQTMTMEATVASLNDAKNIEGDQLAKEQARNKIVAEITTNAKAMLNDISKYGQMLEKESMIQELGLEKKILEARLDLARSTGDVVSARTKLMENELELGKRQYEVAKRVNETLRNGFKENGALYLVAREMGNKIEGAVDEVNKAFATKAPKVNMDAVKEAGDRLVKSQAEYNNAMTRLAENPDSVDAAAAARVAKDNFDTASYNMKSAMENAKKAAEEGGVTIDQSVISKVMDSADTLGKANKATEEQLANSAVQMATGLNATIAAINKAAAAIEEDVNSDPIALANQAIVDMANSSIELAMQLGDQESINNAVTKSTAANNAMLEAYNGKLMEQRKELAAAEAKLAGFTDNTPEKLAAEQAVEVMRANIAKTAAEKEKNYRNNMLDLVKKEFDYKRQVVDLAQEELDIMKDLAESTGANYDVIRSLQLQDLSLASAKAKLAQDEYESAKNRGAPILEVERLRLNLVRQEADITKKAMGAQRDAFDKLMDKAFGSIRSARGARKGIGSAALTMGGKKGGLVYDASGKVVGSGGKTMEARRMQNLIATMGGGRGKGAEAKPEDKNVSAAETQVKAADTQLEAAKMIADASKGFGGFAGRAPVAGTYNTVPGKGLDAAAEKAMGKGNSPEAYAETLGEELKKIGNTASAITAGPSGPTGPVQAVAPVAIAPTTPVTPTSTPALTAPVAASTSAPVAVKPTEAKVPAGLIAFGKVLDVINSGAKKFGDKIVELAEQSGRTANEQTLLTDAEKEQIAQQKKSTELLKDKPDGYASVSAVTEKPKPFNIAEFMSGATPVGKGTASEMSAPAIDKFQQTLSAKGQDRADKELTAQKDKKDAAASALTNLNNSIDEFKEQSHKEMTKQLAADKKAGKSDVEQAKKQKEMRNAMVAQVKEMRKNGMAAIRAGEDSDVKGRNEDLDKSTSDAKAKELADIEAAHKKSMEAIKADVDDTQVKPGEAYQVSKSEKEAYLKAEEQNYAEQKKEVEARYEEQKKANASESNNIVAQRELEDKRYKLRDEEGLSELEALKRTGGTQEEVAKARDNAIKKMREQDQANYEKVNKEAIDKQKMVEEAKRQRAAAENPEMDEAALIAKEKADAEAARNQKAGATDFDRTAMLMDAGPAKNVDDAKAKTAEVEERLAKRRNIAYQTEVVNAPLTPLANGGIVKKPISALIGEAGPEAVVPLSGPLGGLSSAGGAGMQSSMGASSIETLLRSIDSNIMKLSTSLSAMVASSATMTAERPESPEAAPVAAPTGGGGGSASIQVSGTLTSNDALFTAKIESVAATSMRGGQLRQIADSRYVSRT